MPRGGTRPGAGAPRGNTNALVHGRSSARARALLAYFLTVPAFQELLVLLMAPRFLGPPDHRRQQRKLFQARLRGLAQRSNQNDALAQLPDSQGKRQRVQNNQILRGQTPDNQSQERA
ncbi:MAG: hypothetical protein HY685_04950 [Chloroflexi bacterium]|nr:hypothetical protein [Chloroflexota bacterium]